MIGGEVVFLCSLSMSSHDKFRLVTNESVYLLPSAHTQSDKADGKNEWYVRYGMLVNTQNTMIHTFVDRFYVK